MNPSKEMIENWENDYLSDAYNVINKREREILEGSPLKSHEGMLYGRMYAEWKKKYES
tara:strand:- start:376 stop:549 length:174 start_codon:yes stop_codon:yes gene_type:complete